MENLAIAWNTDGFRDIVDISLIPWGHGQLVDSTSDNTSPSVWCQHGSNECLAQRITACVATLASSDETMDFVINLAMTMYGEPCDDPTEMAEDVVRTLGMDWQDIADCVDSTGIADTVTMEYYESTAALDPALDWVPWVTLDGQHTVEMQRQCEGSALQCVASVYEANGGTFIVAQPQSEFVLNWFHGAMQSIAHTELSTVIVLSLLFTLFMVSGMLQFYRWWAGRERNAGYIKL